MPLAGFHFFFYFAPLFRVFRDTRTPNSSGIVRYICTGGIDGDWNDGRAMDSSLRIFLSLPDNRNWFERPQGRKTFSIFADCNETCEGQRFFTLFRAWFRRDTPSPGNGPPLLGRFFYSLSRGYLSLTPKPFKDFPYPSQSTSVAQFTFASFLFPSIFPFTYFTPSCSDQSTGVNLILCTCLKFSRWILIRIRDSHHNK